MTRLHSHPCGCCGTPTPCDGTIEGNYDGFPASICALYHLPGGFVNQHCLCESCAAAYAADVPAPFNYDATVDALAILHTAVRAAASGPLSAWQIVSHAESRLDRELHDYLRGVIAEQAAHS